jgi:hypothetical protein
MWSKTAVLRVLFDTSRDFSRSAVSRYVSLLPSHVPHIDDIAPCVGLLSICFGVEQELAMWSKTAVLRVLFDTSGDFSRSSVSRYASLLPAHAPRIDDIAPCVGLLSICSGVLQTLAMWSKMTVFVRSLYHLQTKQFWGSAESRYVYSLPLHVPHIDDVAPCVEPFLYHFGADQELAMWSKTAVLCVFIPPRSSSGDPLSQGMSICPRRTSHTWMMSHHVLGRSLFASALTRSSPCGPK